MKRNVFKKAVMSVLKDMNPKIKSKQYHDVISNDPKRANIVGLYLFTQGECNSERAQVIRQYLHELNEKGYISWEKE